MAVEGSLQQPDVNTTTGQGYWPAFWMLGGPARAVGATNWPSVGEVDFMEDTNGRSLEFATFHCGIFAGGPCNETTGIGSGAYPCPGCQTAYHTYRFEWDRSLPLETFRWYLDGVQFHTVNQSQVPANVWTDATNHGYFLILNVAMGGGWPGNPTAQTVSGVPMKVDYVRVYYAGLCTGCPTPTVPPTPTNVPTTPYLGSPVSLPDTIQAENFDLGGELGGFHETTPSNLGGYAYRTDQASSGSVDIANNCGVCVNYIAPSEWLRYAVSVASPGAYTFNFRHAGPGGGVFHVATTTGLDLTGPITQPNTGGWGTYATYSKSVTLPAGTYGLKLVFDSCPSSCNLNNVDWISFDNGGATSTPAPPTTTPTRTNTPVPPTATPTRTNTPSGPTATPTRTNTPAPPTATPTKTNTPTGPTATPGGCSGGTGYVLYVLSGGSLCRTAGTAAAVDTISSAGGGNYDGTPHNPNLYTLSGLTGTYQGSGITTFNLYVDAGINVGDAPEFKILYDFTGDGTWDRTETWSYFATDDLVGWQLYNQGSGSGIKASTGSYANLNNGKVQIQIWNAIGNSATSLRVSATAAQGQQSTITLPFN